jgi:hypothetical protein
MKPLFKKSQSEHFSYDIEIGQVMTDVKSEKKKANDAESN